MFGESERAPFTPTQQRVVEGPLLRGDWLPLLAGRTFDSEDDERAPRRIVISQELARQVFPSENPIGQRLRVADSEPEIIGVVGDVALGPRTEPRPYACHSHSQFAGDRNWAPTQVVAFDGNRASLAGDARRELARIDPALILHEPRMLDEVIGRGTAQEQFALGAPARAVRSMIVRDGARLAALGIGVGLLAALGVTRSLQALLFEVSATEPVGFAAAALILGAVAVIASWIPARAATKADPLQAVRD